MNPRTLTIFATTTLLALVASGCGSSTEDSKPPTGANYYQGEMKPKGKGASANPDASAPAGTGTSAQ